MISRRNNYNYLLDNLRELNANYIFSTKGEVYNIIGDEISNERIIANMRFCRLYREAYNATRYIENNETKEKNEVYDNLALYDYNTFNSFINNCVNECRMYNNIGGDDYSYIPFQGLATFMFNTLENKNIVIDYLRHEFEDILIIEQNKKMCKKRV